MGDTIEVIPLKVVDREGWTAFADIEDAMGIVARQINEQPPRGLWADNVRRLMDACVRYLARTETD